jgi:Tol biopolymer transport system component
MKLMRIAQVTIVAAIIVAAQSMKDDPGARLRGAIEKESVDGDLKAAIKQYGDIVARYRKTDRAVAATALVRMGEAHQKLGNADARKIFEQVVKEFADQKEAVALAKAALGGGAQAGQQATRLVWTGDREWSKGTFSPDGRYLSFTDWKSSNLGLHDLATGTVRLLTNKGEEVAFAEYPAISRDGKQVAYGWYSEKKNRHELRIGNLPASGLLEPRQLFDHEDVEWIGPHDWSPDGKWLAVALMRKDRSWQIGLVSTQDGSLRVLKSGTEYKDLGGLSPDGKYLVYTRGRPGPNSGGYIISADGEAEFPLLSGSSSVQDPVWTPDGSRVVFLSDRSGSRGLWSVQVVDGKPVGEPELLKAGFGDDHYSLMGFARDGSLYYAAGIGQPMDIYVAGLDPASGLLTSGPRRVNQRSIGNSQGRVAWLPDGKSLSFFNVGSGTRRLVVHALATGQEREVAGVKQYSGWFPDGSLMSYQYNPQMVTFRRVDARTGEAQATWTVPALPSGAAELGFSPDLMTWYFRKIDVAVPCEGAKCTLVILARDLETGRDREVSRINTTILRNMSISHDGREMVFLSWDGPAHTVIVVPTAGGAPRELYRDSDDDLIFEASAWMPDGGHVVLLCSKSGGGEVWSFPTKGGPPERSSLPAQSSKYKPEVSPDGTQIAFVGGNRKPEIWVMTGLLPDTRPTAAR